MLCIMVGLFVTEKVAKFCYDFLLCNKVTSSQSTCACIYYITHNFVTVGVCVCVCVNTTAHAAAAAAIEPNADKSHPKIASFIYVRESTTWPLYKQSTTLRLCVYIHRTAPRFDLNGLYTHIYIYI